MPGSPLRLSGTVSTSHAYIAHGSSRRSPIGNATVGEVGVEIRSTFSNASSKSRRISVRVRSAVP